MPPLGRRLAARKLSHAKTHRIGTMEIQKCVPTVLPKGKMFTLIRTTITVSTLRRAVLAITQKIDSAKLLIL